MLLGSIIMFAYLTANTSTAYAPKPATIENVLFIQNNSVMGLSPHWIPRFQVLAVLTDYDSVRDKYPFVDCIIQKESGWNPKAVGDDGKAYSLFQFHRATFDQFSAKYKMELDYYNPNDQLLLFEKMLDEDFNLIRHWTTAKTCLRGKWKL